MAVTRSGSKASNRRISSSVSSSKDKTSTSNTNEKGYERTPDGHFFIIKGRKWRATDPMIPEDVRKELLHFHALGRSGTRVAKGKGKQESDNDVKLASKRTGLAKLGLGERGKPTWWEDTDDNRRKRWKDALEQLRKLDDATPEDAKS